MDANTGQADGKKRALGKGIESLLGPRPQTQPAAAPAEANGKPLEIPVERIDRNPNQTRTVFDEAKLQELAQSISANGVVQPVVVREVGGRYQLIMGERRWRASQIAGKATIPAIVRQVSDEQAMEMTIIENLQRADLNPMEQARAFDRLSREFRLTQEAMAAKTGKNRSDISNYVRLLKLPLSVQSYVESGDLSYGHARALLALESTTQMEFAAADFVANGHSVRQAENYVAGMLDPENFHRSKLKVAKVPEDPNVREAQDMLQRKLGLKVRIEDKRGKGRVIIEYSGVEDFDAILGALGE